MEAALMSAISVGAGVVAGEIAAAAIFTTLAQRFVFFAILGAISKSLQKTPAITSQGTTVTGTNTVAPRRIVYGKTRVGGTIVYMEGTDSNEYLHMVITLAGHEIESVESVYFNDEEVTFDGSGNVNSGTYSGKARIEYKLGTTGQTAFSNLVSESDSLWTSSHRLKGVACLYVRLQYDTDIYTNGVPNISALIKGKKDIYDPRSSTTGWSDNSALCVANYLSDSVYGVAVDVDDIESAESIAAANICDEQVALDAGGTESRYTTNGSFTCDSRPEDIINGLLTSSLGKAVFVGGKWYIKAGAYYTPTLTFDENDLRGGINVQAKISRRESFNSVKGVFQSIDDNYVATDFPPVIGDGVTNDTLADYIAEDGGDTVFRDVELPFTVGSARAQRVAKLELEKARQQISVNLPLNLVGIKAKVGDVVNIDNTRMGWSAKPFEVVGLKFAYGVELGVDLALRETASGVFNWDEATDESSFDPAPNTNLPSPHDDIDITDLEFTEKEFSNGARGTLSWTASSVMAEQFAVDIIGAENAPEDYRVLTLGTPSDPMVGVFVEHYTGEGNKLSVDISIPEHMSQSEWDAISVGELCKVSGCSNPNVDGLLWSVRYKAESGVSGVGGGDKVLRLLNGKHWEVAWGTRPDVGGTSVSLHVGASETDVEGYASVEVAQTFTIRDAYMQVSGLPVGAYIARVTAMNALGRGGTTNSIYFEVPPPPLPDKISGLEIDLGEEGEANGDEWTGRDVKIKWREGSVEGSHEVDTSGGISFGGSDSYIKDYQVKVYNPSGIKLRTEYVTDTWYIYTYEKNAEDAAKNSTGPYRQLSFYVKARGIHNQLSEVVAIL